MAKPKYITELEGKINACELMNKEIKMNQDNLMITQADLLRKQSETHDKTMEIHLCLMGTEYDKEANGGLVKKINRIYVDVELLKAWKNKITVTGTIMYSILTGVLAFLTAVIVKNWDKIFPTQ